MKQILIILLVVTLVGISCQSDKSGAYFILDVQMPVISLDGDWMISVDINEMEPQIMDDNLFEGVVEVPGEVMIQGFSIKHDTPFVLRRYIDIPADYDGKVVKLLFEGVYSYARVWIDEHYIRDHSGGFTAWECDISNYVKAGGKSMITVEITDKMDEISYASGYAKHQIGGILRSVSLMALPESHPENVIITTKLDDDYKDATLTVQGEIVNSNDNETLILVLYDPSGKMVPLHNNQAGVRDDNFILVNNIPEPLLWDAEHPNLYKLIVDLKKERTTIYRKEYKIGFRQVEVSGNKLLVNGKEVKLRGANRHDIHPRLGRVSTKEYELKDVLLAKEANINFIRTSHYPPSNSFLDYCDEYGIYVEDETAVCFVGTHRTGDYAPAKTESSPEYTDRYLSQLNEMIDNHRNHPSVILWSIGNENLFGENFLKSYQLVKKKDITRPVIFSYPDKVPGAPVIYEVLSKHYPPIDGNTILGDGRIIKSFGFEEMPVLFDEYLHVPCYNKSTLIEDPNARDFWGEGLDIAWEGIFAADGGLGAAIWGMIDETFMMPETLEGFGVSWGQVHKDEIPPPYSGYTVGYGEWGIVDTWRRKKPEFWNTKKAYSPVRILNDSLILEESNKRLLLTIYNRFDHTDIDELKIEYTLTGNTYRLDGIESIEPHQKGLVEIPLEQDPDSKGILISFYDHAGLMIDMYRIRGQIEYPEQQPANDNSVELFQDDDLARFICGEGKELRFSTENGLLQSILEDGKQVKIRGPYLNLRTKGKEINAFTNVINDYGAGWKSKEISFETEEDNGIIKLAGTYNTIEFVISMLVHGSGKIDIDYSINNAPGELIRELGIYFQIEGDLDHLSWIKDGYWSIYPENHISCNVGNEPLFPVKLNKYRQEPVKEWRYDNKSFYYDGSSDESPDDLSRIAAATKEKVHFYSVISREEPVISVLGDGNVSCRLSKDGEVYTISINSLSDYCDLGWGDYQRNIIVEGSYKNRLTIQL